MKSLKCSIIHNLLLFVPHLIVFHYYGSNNPEPSFIQDGSPDYILVFLFNSKEFKKTHLTPRTQKKKKRLFKSVNNLPLLFFPLFLAPCTDTAACEFTC